MVEKSVSQVKERASDTWDRLEQVFENRVSKALGTLGIPGREELEQLAKRVDELSKAVRALDAGNRAQAAKKPAVKAATPKAAAPKAPTPKAAAPKAAAPKAAAAKAAAAPAPAAPKAAAPKPRKAPAKKVVAAPTQAEPEVKAEG